MTLTNRIGRDRSRRTKDRKPRAEDDGRARRRSRAPTHEYPRPQLVRQDWTSLNGPWQFAFDRDAVATAPADIDWTEGQQILVPFAPETPLSGINDVSYC